MRIIKFKSDEEWLKYRKSRIGASDASIIMGVSKWKTSDGRIKTPKLLWEEKLGLGQIQTDTYATRYGKRMEEPARKVYEKMVGDLFAPDVVINDKYPHLMASLDGFNATRDKAVEIKNANKEDHELARQGKVPDKYYPQVQQQMMVSDLNEIDYFSFNSGEGIIVTVKRDKPYVLVLAEALYNFWECVKAFKEPPLTENDYIERDDEWEGVSKKLFELKQTKKDVVKQEKELEVMLRELSMGENSMKGHFMYTHTLTKGTIDYKAIPELSEVDLEKYRKPSSRWSLKRIS